jgi:hypothetical protein
VNRRSAPRALALAAILAAILAALPSAASADGGAGALYDRGSWPDEIVRRPLTLASTLVELKLPLVANLSKGSTFEPWFVAPELALGVTDDVTLRVYTPEGGRGLCLAGSGHGCSRSFDDLAAELLVSVARQQQHQFVLRAGVEAYRLSDPALLAARAGGAWKASMGNLGLTIGGDLRVGVTERDRGNVRETLDLWGRPQIQLSPSVGLEAEIGAELDLQPRGGGSIGDTLRIPLFLGLEWGLLHRVGLGGGVRFPDLFGRNGSTDWREFVIFAEVFL